MLRTEQDALIGSMKLDGRGEGTGGALRDERIITVGRSVWAESAKTAFHHSEKFLVTIAVTYSESDPAHSAPKPVSGLAERA